MQASLGPQVFLTHLHSDHIADLATFYVDAMFGRTKPWEVWGPSSEKPELGLNASIAGLRQVLLVSTFFVYRLVRANSSRSSGLPI